MIQNTRNRILLVTGFVSIPVQVLLIREFLLAFGGNELLIGFFLAAWMLFTACGSWFARNLHLSENKIIILAALWILIPSAMQVAADLTGGFGDLPGMDGGPLRALSVSALIMFTFCFASGVLFAAGSRSGEHDPPTRVPGWPYALESLGGMAGGLLLTFGLMPLQDNFRSAAIISLLAASMLILGRKLSVVQYLVFVPVTVLSAGLLITGSHTARSFLFRGQEMLQSTDSPYGNITATRQAGQLNLFGNHLLLFSGDNSQVAAEAVHFALLQADHPKKVLLISGGLAGLPEEILLHTSVKSVDYLEIDPVMISFFRRYHEKVPATTLNLVQEDPRIFLRTRDTRYDAVILSLPEPESFQLNRYYSLEFMRLVKKHLNTGGVFSFTLPVAPNYLNSGMELLFSSLRNTCLSVFKESMVLPGIRATVVASDQSLQSDIAYLSNTKHLDSDYINYYINDMDLGLRSRQFEAQLNPEVRVNTDYNTVAVRGYYLSWAEKYGFSMNILWGSAGVLILLTLGFLSFGSRALSAVFAAGMVSSGLQVILLLAYQVVYGQVLGMMALITAVFMGALALGVRAGDSAFHYSGNRKLLVLLLILALAACSIPLVIRMSQRAVQWPWLVSALFLLATAGPAFVTGRIFSAGTKLVVDMPVAQLFAADLAGAALGAILAVLIVIPLAGVLPASFLAALPAVWMAAVLTLKQK